VDVVAAGVHDVGCGRRVVEPSGLLNGQGVDVAADGDEWGGAVTARDTRDDAGSGDALDVRNAEVAECGLESLGGLVFLPGKFRVLMQPPSERDELAGLVRYEGVASGG
jgi:hypothetical protein